MPRLLLRSEAESDILAAYNWYGSQAPGLETEFLRAVDAGLDAIQRDPLQYPTVHKRIRRKLLRRFPYALFYLTSVTDKNDNEPEIVVLACFHARRDPQNWQERRRDARS